MPSRKAQAMALRLQGYTFAKIGLALGVSPMRAAQLSTAPSAVRQIIAERAHYRCQSCGIPQARKGTKGAPEGQVHHVSSGLEENYRDLDNLRYLCLSCHRRSHLSELPLDSV